MKWLTWLQARAQRAHAPASGAALGGGEMGEAGAVSPSAEDEAPDEPVEAGGLDFVAAIRAHQAWKGRLMAVVNGQSTEALEPAAVSRDDVCVLGCWLHGQGARFFAGTPLLPAVTQAHARFHQLAGQVVALAQQNEGTQARQLLAGEYHRASVRVQGQLAELFLQHAATAPASAPR